MLHQMLKYHPTGEKRGDYMSKILHKTIKFELRVLRQELQNKLTTKEHKQLLYIEISAFVRGYCYGSKNDISQNSYKLITNYMDRLYDKYLR